MGLQRGVELRRYRFGRGIGRMAIQCLKHARCGRGNDLRIQTLCGEAMAA